MKNSSMKPKPFKDEQIALINNEITHLRKDIADIKDKSDPDNIFDEMSKKVDQLIRLVSEIKLEMETALHSKSEVLNNSSGETLTKKSQCPKFRCPSVDDSLTAKDPTP